jgi:hypothetical protein
MAVALMLKSVFVLLILTFTGCATTVTLKLHDGKVVSPGDLTIVSSNCNSECEAAIERAYDFKQGLILLLGPQISALAIQKVDGTLGNIQFNNNCGQGSNTNIYNQRTGWGYTLELLPGAHTFNVYLANCALLHHSNYDIVVELEAGHRYALVQVQKRKAGSAYYENTAREWFPVLYDYKKKTIVYDGKALKWLNP